ncbi:HPP family protein [Methyloversatilis thermotolerans]|uniref:HPP family protein n=1 Tax=Methyloversatilis thermotolerans TaxID=1346290 RepID=UPI00037E9275|nr:HPP family protein [Methyloversatilis thermotolerans]
MSALPSLLRRYLVSDAPPLSRAERWRSTLAGFAGLLLFEGVLFVLPVAPDEKHVLAPLGATSVILFALPHSPLAQPWSVIGGLLIAAPVGYACGCWLPAGPWVMACALAASLWLTAWARCIHPPAGAMALTMAAAASQGLSFEVSMFSVLANTIAIMIAVMVVNNGVPGRRYPQGTPPAAQVREHLSPPALSHRDLAAALGEIDSFLDVREDDLVDLYERTLRRAFERMHGVRCGDLIEPDTPSPMVEFATPLSEAWLLMRRAAVDALPVVDRSRRVIGMLALEDFLRAVTPGTEGRLGTAMKAFLSASPASHSDKAEVVGQMMREPRNGLKTVHTSDSVAAAAELLAGRHQPAIAVVDTENRLVGMLDRGDLVAALYHRVQIADAIAGA